MEWRDEKRRLYDTLIHKGLERQEILPGETIAPPELTAKWVRSFYGVPGELRLSNTPRLLNRFSIGADPELVFVDAITKRYTHAESLGMDTLAAFGCDMSGRQAELRAKPSRFALDVVASLMEALRWMAATYPTYNLKWLASSYIEDVDGHRDGCGGHIHLGRKRPGIEDEVGKLNDTYYLLLLADVFDRPTNDYRQKMTKYGRPNDYRQQVYGYEYRTFPTWLSDPWAAYLALVISKLAVLHRVPLNPIPSSARAQQQIKNLLCLYKGLDDDALIAWKAMQVLGMPKASAVNDIKASWGVNAAPPRWDASTCYVPSVIEPDSTSRQELFNWLTKGTPIPKRDPVPTWAPFNLPSGFYKVRVQPHVFNIPDLAMGLVSRGVQVSIEHDNALNFSSSIPLPEKEIRKRLDSFHCAFHSRPDPVLRVGIPSGLREVRDALHALKAVLSDTTLFPICRVEDIDNVDWTRWTSLKVAEKKVITTLGRKIATVYGQRAEQVEEGF